MLSVLFTIYSIIIYSLGNASLIVLIAYYGVKIYQHFKLKKITKEYAEKIHKSNFLYDAAGKMSEEEQKKMKENGKATTKVTLNFDDISVKKETK